MLLQTTTLFATQMAGRDRAWVFARPGTGRLSSITIKRVRNAHARRRRFSYIAGGSKSMNPGLNFRSSLSHATSLEITHLVTKNAEKL